MREDREIEWRRGGLEEIGKRGQGEIERKGEKKREKVKRRGCRWPGTRLGIVALACQSDLPHK